MSSFITSGLLVVVGIVLAYAAVSRAGKRFARRKERQGMWGPEGPIHPTVGPPPDYNYLLTPHFDDARLEFLQVRFAEDEAARAQLDAAVGPALIRLVDKETGQLIGKVSEAEFRFLNGELERDSSTERDFYLDADTIAMIEHDGAPKSFVELLRRGLRGRDSYEVQW